MTGLRVLPAATRMVARLWKLQSDRMTARKVAPALITGSNLRSLTSRENTSIGQHGVPLSRHIGEVSASGEYLEPLLQTGLGFVRAVTTWKHETFRTANCGQPTGNLRRTGPHGHSRVPNIIEYPHRRIIVNTQSSCI